MTHRVSIILPAFNEAPNVEEAVRQALDVSDDLLAEAEVIVIDDGSTDDTAAIVRRLSAEDDRVRLEQHERNRGYGEAVRTGLSAARLNLVFLTDADLQFDLHELKRFLPLIDHVDVVAGYRIDRQDSAMRRLTARVWNWIVRVVFYVPVRDIDCAFKLFRREVFDDIDLSAVGAMVSTEVMVRVARSGCSVVEVGVTHYPRTAGKARGAAPSVIVKAVAELLNIRRHLLADEQRASRHPMSQ